MSLCTPLTAQWSVSVLYSNPYNSLKSPVLKGEWLQYDVSRATFKSWQSNVFFFFLFFCSFFLFLCTQSQSTAVKLPFVQVHFKINLYIFLVCYAGDQSSQNILLNILVLKSDSTHSTEIVLHSCVCGCAVISVKISNTLQSSCVLVKDFTGWASGA